MSLIIAFIWIVFVFAVGAAASRRYNRDGFGWGLIALFISPLLAWLLLLLLGPLPPPRQLQPEPVVNWNRIDWAAGEIVKPRQIVLEPAPAIEPLSQTAMWCWIAALVILVVVMFALIASNANAGEQSRVYAPDGRSIGTVVPQGDGSRFYDARGNSRGTSTTTGNTTKDYDARGNVLGTTTAPRGDRWPR
jgi:YD repeat-containing protein